MSDHDDKSSDFEREASEPQQGLVREFVDFLPPNKQRWLTPTLPLPHPPPLATAPPARWHQPGGTPTPHPLSLGDQFERPGKSCPLHAD